MTNINYMKQTIKIKENKLRGIIKEAITSVLIESSNKFETWYRGYNSKFGSQHTNLFWITNDISYAKTYGNRVEEIILDLNKLHLASIYQIDEILGYNFDYYDGLDVEESQILLSQGYNGYAFYANSDDSECICLFDLSPIVRRRELSKEEFDSIREYDGFDYKSYDDEY